MSIQCAKCKSTNPPPAERCQTCGTDLLPGIGRFRLIVGITMSLFLQILLGIFGFIALLSAAPLLGCALIAIVAYLAFYLRAFVKAPPLSQRYESRARRHKTIDPEQAYADFTKAIRLAPRNVGAYQGRSLLYDRVALSTEDLTEEIEFLANSLKASGRFRDKLREELVKEIIELSTRRMNGEGEAGLGHESLSHMLQLLDFMEANVNDIRPFKTATVGFGTGVTLQLRGQLRKNIQKTRTELFRGGLVKAIGYCRRCREDVEPDLDLDCPKNRSHGKVDRVRFFVPDPPSNHRGNNAERPTVHG